MRSMMLAVVAIMAVACWVSPAAASGRSMIEFVTADGSPLSPNPESIMYNWSDTSPSGIMRGMPDIPLTDPRLQPGPEGYPEQVGTMYYGPTTIRFGWSTGQYQVGYGELAGNHDNTRSDLQIGVASGAYTEAYNGTSTHYNYTYYDFPGALNYTSGKLHSVIVEDLVPGTTYFYRVGDASTQYWSDEFSFTMPPSAEDGYPFLLGILGDVGQTANSSDTFKHLIASEPQAVVLAGDLCYADVYLSNGTLYPFVTNQTGGIEDPPGPYVPAPLPEQGTFQPRWDSWGRLASPAMTQFPFMFSAGNHEMEVQSNNESFVSYTTRYPANAAASGSSSPLWYSQTVGPMHITFITSYAPYDQSSPQYAWLENDLANVNRTETPWLIAVFHAPWYTSYRSHYMEANCQRLDMETLLYENGVDVVFNGHVHAYERTFPVYNFTLNNCGPTHITIGDGGNVEKLAAVFADLPGECPTVTEYGPTYQPQACPQYLYDGKYCATSQPFWSAFREPSFGHSTLEIHNATHAYYEWKRNEDNLTSVGDSVWLKRDPESCGVPLEGLNSDRA